MKTKEYIEVVNLEKYQPHYKDGRKLIWIRWDISALSDFKITSMPVNGRWLFMCLICMATESKNEIPFDKRWLSHISGVDKKRIPILVGMLQELGMVVTKCHEMCLQTDIQTDIQTEEDSKFGTEEKADWNEPINTVFNHFLLKTGKVLKLNDERKMIIKGRLEEGFSEKQLKKAIDNFSEDDWVDRRKFTDVIYCLGKQKGKQDNLEKWINFEPEQKKEKIHELK
jgi:hypothetical protein